MKQDGDGKNLDDVFAALGHSVRRAILHRLAAGDASVAELAAPFALTQPAISRHLKVLEDAGLVVQERAAQRRPRRLQATPFAEAATWLAGFRQLSKRVASPAAAPAAKSAKEPELKKKKDKKHKHKKH